MATPRPKKVKYIFLNDELHKVLKVQRLQDTLVAWNYPEKKRRLYVLSDARKKMERAWTVVQVAEIINRHKLSIHRYIKEEKIRRPQMTYHLDTNEPGTYFFSEKDIWDLYDYLEDIHIGPGHNPNFRNTNTLPTRDEIRSLVKGESFLYNKDAGGKFVPVWRESSWQI